MEILLAVFIFGVAGATTSGFQKSASSAHRSHNAVWAAVAETLGLSLVTSRFGPLGTAGVEGIVDGLTVSVTRPSPFSVFGSGTGDRIVYSVGWPRGSAPTDMRLGFVHEWDQHTLLGTPVRRNSLDGLQLLRGDPTELAGWLTPDREAALASLLADGTGRRRTDRRVLVEDGRLELVLDWRSRSTDEIVTTTRRLIEVASVLWSQTPASPAIEPPAVHPLDGVAAALQDTLVDEGEPIVIDPEPVVAPTEIVEPQPTEAELVAPIPAPRIDAPPSPAEPAPVADNGDFPIDQAVAVLLDRSLMGHEATAIFEEHHRDRIVTWSGVVTARRPVANDPDFEAAGLRTTVHVYRIDDSPLVTNQVHAILLLTPEAAVSVGDKIAFAGRLHRVDRTMRNFFVADATLAEAGHDA